MPVAINADAYYSPFSSPNFVTVFISWLNLDISLDVCFFDGMDDSNKALIELTFPTYVIFLEIIIIIISECSAKFAKLIGKGNPVAALATMILFSYTKFFNAIARSVFLLYLFESCLWLTRPGCDETRPGTDNRRQKLFAISVWPNPIYFGYFVYSSYLLLAMASTISK